MNEWIDKHVQEINQQPSRAAKCCAK